MDNIINYLSFEVNNAFNKVDYAKMININPKIMNVHFYNENHICYVFRGLISISKLLLEKNIKMTPNTIGEVLLQHMNLNKDMWGCKIDNNSIIFDPTMLNLNILLKHVLELDDNVILNTTQKNKILVDFSSPNIAKDMHVGHLRSTIIGDSICRLFEQQGHNVLRINHIGDFGLQFGMLIQYIFDNYPNFENDNINITDLQTFYAESKKCFDNSSEFKKKAYEKVVSLQSNSNNDNKVINAWNFIKDVSRKAYNDLYTRLDITLDEVGESFYQPMIPNLIEELKSKKLLELEDGRQIIRVKSVKVPLTIVKSDGGYTYDTTDLAAIRYRLVDLNVDKLYYVVDVGQSNHFKQIFEVAKTAGWLKSNQLVEHIGFGLVLNEDNRRFRSRDGDTVKLVNLLDEAIQRVDKVNNTKNRGFSEEYTELINKNIGYGAIKYADLSTTRTKDYVFSFDSMLALKGNTAPYLLYAYVRICSIIRVAGNLFDEKKMYDIDIKEVEECELAKYILHFMSAIEKLSSDLMFHGLSAYLYELSEHFNRFFVKCRCIQFDDDTGKQITFVNYSRLLLCAITKKIMKQCFYILGINVLDRM